MGELELSDEGNEILENVISEYLKLNQFLHINERWKSMSEDELWQELCLCILSSNVPYELAESAFLHLKEGGLLELEWTSNFSKSQEAIADELSKPLYLPQKRDGSCRKYRFPNVRARDIVKAAQAISNEEKWLVELLSSSPCATTARDSLVDRISGIGLKEASHFLRNIGYSSNLAIVDSHVALFLRKVEQFPNSNSKTITGRLYLELENRLLHLCERFNLDPSIFDMAIWRYMRRQKE